MRIAIIIALISLFSYVVAAPRNQNPESPGQIWQNDQDLRDDIKVNKGTFTAKSLADLKRTTPLKTGIAYYCSDCATSAVCVSTGVAIFGFSDIAARAMACK